MSKVIYILGAGFSRYAGAPSQDKILDGIIILSKPTHIDLKWPSFENSRQLLIEFIKKVFNPTTEEMMKKISLEDLFTFLDKAMLERSGFSTFTEENVENIREALNFCIVYLFDNKLSEGRPDFYNNLGKAIIKKRKEAGQHADPLAIISLNWDIILDNALFEAIEQENSTITTEKVGIDYCCYTTHRITGEGSMLVKAKGGYNIKMQKLHGSFNWLSCPTCGRLYYDIGFKVSLLTFVDKMFCPYCHEVGTLGSLFITPTLLKDLDNTHLRMVWHNADLDLREANRIVFVGYSLPLADFQLRYILKKSIKHSTKIEVVLKSGTKDFNEVKERYELFFGKSLEKVHDEGSELFFSEEFGFSD